MFQRLDHSAGEFKKPGSALDSNLQITPKEKLFIGANAGIAAFGTTLGLLLEGLWFLTTDIESGGIGVAITGAAATSSIIVATSVSLFAAIPIAFITYHEMITEARALRQQFETDERERIRLQEALFYQLLRLRCLSENDDAFSRDIYVLLQESLQAIDVANLIHQLNDVYHSLSKMNYSLTFSQKTNSPLLEKSECSSESFIDILKNNDYQTKSVIALLIDEIKNHDPEKETDIHQHFLAISMPAVIKRRTAIAWGITMGLNAAGICLGSGWGFGSLAISGAIAATIPVVGWILFGLACLVVGIAFGYAFGVCKQKNIQRIEANKALGVRNAILKMTEQKVEDARCPLGLRLQKRKLSQGESKLSLVPSQAVQLAPILSANEASSSIHLELPSQSSSPVDLGFFRDKSRSNSVSSEQDAKKILRHCDTVLMTDEKKPQEFELDLPYSVKPRFFHSGQRTQFYYQQPTAEAPLPR